MMEDDERKLMPPPPLMLDKSKLVPILPPRKVGFFFPKSLPSVTGKIHKRDYNLMLELHSAYKLIEKMKSVRTPMATWEQLSKFHSEDYLEVIRSLSVNEINEDTLEEYGLLDDVEEMNELWDHICAVAGASLCAAYHLTNKDVDVSINYVGGRHHAKKDQASGYCYVNDVVLAILHLKKTFNRVMYIDIDAHHGDGVEEAFYYSGDVFTLSLHKYVSGFFPHTGSIQKIGKGDGKYLNVNVPLKDGINDLTYIPLFRQVFTLCYNAFKPNAIVLQCGADTLAGDEVGGLNLTLKGIGECVKEVLMTNKPTLILGGGGYNCQNTARCWTYITSIALGEKLNEDIPEHDYISEYSPSFSLNIKESKKENMNTRSYTMEIVNQIMQNIQKLEQKL